MTFRLGDRVQLCEVLRLRQRFTQFFAWDKHLEDRDAPEISPSVTNMTGSDRRGPPVFVDLLLEDRGDSGYQNLEEFLGHDALAGLQLEIDLDVSTAYFRVLTDVQVGQGEARLESLLVRGEEGVQVIYRIRSPLRLVTALPQGDAVN